MGRFDAILRAPPRRRERRRRGAVLLGFFDMLKFLTAQPYRAFEAAASGAK